MIILPGNSGKDLCDKGLAPTRRDIVRAGGAGMLGFSLGSLFQLQSQAKASGKVGGPGWGKAKSVILCYLQGGPSHIDLWDPKENVPDNVKSVFKNIKTKTPGLQFTEVLPNLAKVTDKVTMLHAMSYTPNGLFNHTAAIYQMMTGYTTDKVSPSGQLEPPSPKDFPNFGSNIVKMKPPTEPMLPFVMLPRPLQESNVVGKGGTAGFLGKAYDPYTLYPSGGDMDMNLMDKIRVDDLKLRPEVFAKRLQRRASMKNALDKLMPDIEKAVSEHKINAHYDRALQLIISQKAREAFELHRESKETRDMYGATHFGQSCLLARRLVEAGTRVVEVIWPKVANSDNHSWDHHKGLSKRMGTQSGPMLDKGLSGLITDLDQKGLLDETLVVAVGEFGRSPQRGVSTSGNGNSDDGRDHWPYCYTAMIAGAGIKKGYVHGKSDKTASSPVEGAVHPGELLATIYHAIGIDPQTIVFNHLKQPRELVKGEAVTELFA